MTMALVFSVLVITNTTAAIDYNAADTVMKARLEALDNIGTVSVTRTGPSVWKEFDWTITFLSMPGAYPYGSGDVLQLTPDETRLTGIGMNVNVSTTQQGSNTLGGTFDLTLTVSGESQTTASIPADSSASEMESYLNELSNTGTVSVTRTDEADG